jgi:threonyl-tRNA synthetase
MASLPEFVQRRQEKWDVLVARRAEENKDRINEDIKISLPDGKVVDGKAFVTTPLDIATGISSGLAQQCMVAKIDDDKLWDMTRPLESSCSLSLLKFTDPDGEYTFWHSSAHVLGQAIELKFNDAQLCVGPPIEDGGFYYDVHVPADCKVSQDDFKGIETLASSVIKQKQPFVRLELTKDEALDLFSDNQFKARLINSKVPNGERCTAYRCGPLIDLCRGPHLPTTGKVKTFKVTKNSSAYWMGKNTNETLQRLYGISFPDKKLMKNYERMIKEAAARDHRKVGLEQGLYFFNDISPGSAFMLPHGARLYNKLVNFMQDEYKVRGFQEVITPNVFDVKLWKTSGHYANYKDNMFLFQSENVEFGMKPMNCPGHSIMFNQSLKSYRDLPIRYADFGVLHRNELSGALSGLTRVRRFCQDDAHIFCRHDQIKEEIKGALDFMGHVYNILGFSYTLKLSTRPPAKFLGKLSTWNAAELKLAEALNEFGQPWTVDLGDGAFYGPKIDIQLRDALGRKHQCATIQLDFQLPQRFGLQFTNQEGKKEHCVMIHRAILGSVERMLAVLVEHTGGKWPFWLSPRQVQVIPVDLKFSDYANTVRDAVHNAGYFADVDLTRDSLKKKIRNSAKLYNCILVVGGTEAENGTVNLRLRDTPDTQEEMTLAAFIELCNTKKANWQ